MPKSRICKGINKNNKLCKNKTVNEQGYCYRHVLQYVSTPLHECSVCYELLNEKPLKCGHTVHIECIQKYMKAEGPMDIIDCFNCVEIMKSVFICDECEIIFSIV